MDDILRMVEIDCYKDTGSSTHKVFINIDHVNYIIASPDSNENQEVAYSLHMSNGDILQTYHELPRMLKSSLVNSQKL